VLGRLRLAIRGHDLCDAPLLPRQLVARMTVLVGYQHIASAPSCPYCGDKHYAIEDDGNPDTLLVACWCGGHARVWRDDPDIVAYLEANGRGSG
jgi:hypothetical protein